MPSKSLMGKLSQGFLNLSEAASSTFCKEKMQMGKHGINTGLKAMSVFGCSSEN